MLDMQKQLSKAYKNSKLLRIDSIKKEIEQNLNGYTLNNIESNSEGWTCYYTDKNDNHILLTISFKEIKLSKQTNNKFERITINENLILSHRTIEKRENGLIYSIIKKEFAPSERFDNKTILVNLNERRYVLTKEKIETLMNKIDFDNNSSISLLLKLMILEKRNYLKEKCDYYSQFSTQMNYINWEDARDKSIYPTTYLNEQDISSMYKIMGPDSLYRIFDLYRGIINPRNEEDINSINSKSLSQDSYDLKGLRGIKEQEDLLVGKSLDTISQEYISYLKQMIYDNFGYKGNLNLDRESILSGITYRMSVPEMARRMIEKQTRIPYSRFAMQDEDKQYRLLKIRPNKNI